MNPKRYINPRPNIPTPTKREIRIEARFACVVCKDQANIEIAHIDGDRENNDPSNLVVLCPNHHTAYDNRKISRMEIKQLKETAKKENDILSKLQQQLEYLQSAPQINASKEFVNVKLKYQNLLDSYSDKLIFYQCFIYLIPEFYIDNRGTRMREIVREFLQMSSEDEERIISHLKNYGIVDVVGGLISLRDNADAKTALNELIANNKLDLSQLLEKFSTI